MQGMSGYRRYKPWTTRILNAATKHGSVFAQHAGTAATIYWFIYLFHQKIT